MLFLLISESDLGWTKSNYFLELGKALSESRKGDTL